MLVPMEEVVIEPHCSPGVEFVEGSSEEKMEGTPEYVPTSPSVDWIAVADEMAAGPGGRDSLDEDSLDAVRTTQRTMQSNACAKGLS
jgi:hypothetical protein